MAMNFAHQHPVDLSLLSPEDWQKLTEWNNTQLEYDQQKCIHQLIEDQVERSPAAPAILFENQRLTYQELNQQANQLAHYLQTLGVGPEALVGICMERSPKMVVALLAILKAGGAYVPLDPKYPSDRLASISEDAQFPVLITQEHLLNVLPEHQAKVVCVDSVQTILAQQPVNNPTSTTAPSNLAYVLYTSGSTGKPKGVALEHRNTVAFIAWAQHYFTRQQLQGVLASTSVCFDLSVFELFVTLSCGGKVILAQDALQLPNLSAASEVTLINTVPSAIATLLRMNGIPESVNTINLAGEPLQNALVQKLYQLGHVKQVYNLYGPTEDTTYSTAALVPRDADGIPLIGYPISNSQVYLLEEPARRQSDPLRPVPIGTPGEVYLGGAGVARGYLNQPELTAEKFLPNPFCNAPGARLYKTGDLAVYQPDGSLKYLGRIDHQVKIRGFRIELGEIEAVLNQHPEVRESVVVPKENASGDKRLIAYVIPQTVDQESSPEAELGLTSVQQVQRWQSVWDTTYSQSSENYDLELNSIGWDDSFTGLPMPPEQVQEWVDCTVARILALEPKQVLEIGCGMGLLLFRIAPQCTRYVGLDLSAEAIGTVKQKLQQQQGDWSHVTALARPAHELDEFEAESFDTIVLNSVIQYFPDINYLVQVLQSAVRLLKPGGKLFIGDVRNLSLLKAFHAGAQMQRAPRHLKHSDLQKIVQERIAQDKELVLHPNFFIALKQYIPRITHVQTQLKRGRSEDELTRFRSDVTLHIDTAVQAIPEPIHLDWQQQKWSITEIREFLQQQQPETLKICNVLNARIMTEVKAAEVLSEPASSKNLEELKNLIEQETHFCGIHPEDLWNLAQQIPYHIDITWSAEEVIGTYDVIFQQQSVINNQNVTAFPEKLLDLQPLSAYSNTPMQVAEISNLPTKLRKRLKEKLPEYMIPSTFVLMEEFPLTPNGKVDRRSLPEPRKERPTSLGICTQPTTVLEQRLSEIWSQVLDIDQVGIHDNFFELGGHSLLAAQLLAQIEEELQLPIPLFYLLKEPTIVGLIKGIETIQSLGSTNQSQQVTIDLYAEACLDPSIQIQTAWVDSHAVPENIFLTGATGFLGAFLLHELLQQTQANIHCLIRASSLEEAYQKLEATLKRYQLWHGDLDSRVSPVLGDLSEPLLGMSETKFNGFGSKLDAIYHSGAFVNLVYPYADLAAINVKGTQEVLRLASQGKATPVHYISTADVLKPLIYTGTPIIYENDVLDSVDDLDKGYTQTKWVAEQLVVRARERGIPTSIYRPGMLTGHSQTGVANTSDLMCRLIKGIIQLGSAPDLIHSVNMTPIDYASKAIVHLSLQADLLGQAFHIVNPQTLYWNEMVELIEKSGYPMRLLPYDEWQSELFNACNAQDNALTPMRSLFAERFRNQMTYLESFLMTSRSFDCENTLKGLKGTSITCPPVDAKLLQTYLSFFNNSGFLPPSLEEKSSHDSMLVQPSSSKNSHISKPTQIAF